MYTVEDLKKHGLLLIEFITGSHAYGTNVETSDTDVKGIYVMPDEMFCHYNWSPEWEEVKITEDIKYYELRKFLRMLESNNPNTLEILNVPEDCILYKHEAFSGILDVAHLFLSKLCSKSFSGYALDQMNKATGQNKMQNWEVERMTRKTLLEFCYTFKGQGSEPILDWLKDRGLKQEYCGLSAIPHMRYTYGLYYDFGKHIRENPTNDFCVKYLFAESIDNIYDFEIAKEALKLGDDLSYSGILSANSNGMVSLSSIPKGIKPLCHVQINIDGWQTHCKEYKRFETWQEKRNDARWVEVKGHNQKIDGKNMLHMARLLNMSEDIARGKGIVVRRPEAKDLIKIRRGERSLQDLLENANSRITEINELYEKSGLPEKPPAHLAEELNRTIRERFKTKNPV